MEKKTLSLLALVFVLVIGGTAAHAGHKGKGKNKVETNTFTLETDPVTQPPVSQPPVTRAPAPLPEELPQPNTINPTRPEPKAIPRSDIVSKSVFQDTEEPVESNPPNAVVAKPECEDEALKLILSLNNKNNLLGKMWELTAMRLAARALQGKHTTLEQMVVKNAKDYAEKVKAIQGSQEMSDKINTIYRAYGFKQDLETNGRYFELLKNGKNPCYWCKDDRLWNESSSAYVLAMTFNQDDELLSEADVATIWVVEKLRSTYDTGKGSGYQKGSENGNLMNISTRVARYLGRIGADKHGNKGGRSAEESEKLLAGEIQDAEAEIQKAFDDAFSSAKVQDFLKECYGKDGKNGNCEECVTTGLKNFKEKYGDVREIQKALLKVMGNSDEQVLTNRLKGYMKVSGGEDKIEFDLSNFISGSVKRDTRKGRSPCPDNPRRSPVKKATR